jgi:outer membrane autotransporter protein
MASRVVGSLVGGCIALGGSLVAGDALAQADQLISNLRIAAERQSHAEMSDYYIEACIRYNAAVDFDFEAELAPGPQDTRLRCNTVWSVTVEEGVDLRDPLDPFTAVARAGIGGAAPDEAATQRGQSVNARVNGQALSAAGLGAASGLADNGVSAVHWSSRAAGDAMSPWTVNLSGFYANADQSPNDFEPGFDSDDYGVNVNVDHFVSERFSVGGGFAFHDVDADVKANGGSLSSKSYNAFVYAGFTPNEHWYLDGLVNYGWSDHSQTRTVRYQEIATAVQPNAQLIDQVMSASNDSDGWAFSASAGYNFFAEPWTITPYARMDYADTDIDGFTETPSKPGQPGFGLALVIDDQDYQTFVSSFGLTFTGEFALGSASAYPYAFGEYSHEFENDSRDLSGRFVTELDPSQSFSVPIAPPDRNYFNAGAGVLVSFTDTLVGFLRYQGQFGYRGLDVHSVELSFRQSF